MSVLGQIFGDLLGNNTAPQKPAAAYGGPPTAPTPDLATSTTSPATTQTNMTPSQIQQAASPMGSPAVSPLLQPDMTAPVTPSAGVNTQDPTKGGMGVGT